MSSEESSSANRRYFDNTILASYKRCPREYFLRHVLSWRKEGISNALVFGLAWHAAQDVLWTWYHKTDREDLLRKAEAAFDQAWVEAGGPEPTTMGLEELGKWSPRTPMVAREMLRSYLEKREHILGNCELLACEQPFAVPLPLGPDLPGSNWYAGRLDKVVQERNIVAIEHKTTTDYKVDGGFRSTYLESWYLDSQILGYLYGGGLFFTGLEAVWVDAALAHNKVHNAFKFIPISHRWEMLDQWIADTKEWVRRIMVEEQLFKQNNKLMPGNFPKQTESCMTKFGPCQFLGICRTTPDPSRLEGPPDGYVKEVWSPFDVLKLDQLLKGNNDVRQ